MKIKAPIRQAYQDQRPLYEALKQRIDDLFQGACRDRRWHYESRVKDELSYALKIETGRVPALDNVEDFFGCTIVVRNSSEIGTAVKFVKQSCSISYRRPPSPSRTNHRPATFEFDDLRLYVTLNANPGAPPNPATSLTFEVQIKTFLFHAWAIATHDLMYKANDVNWGRERIAFQVRAMLEQAETSIEQAQQLAAAASLGKEDRETQELRTIIDTITGLWPRDQLPADLRRLSQNIRDLLSALKLAQQRWKTLVEGEKAGPGLPLDENPYQTSVRLLFQHEQGAVQAHAQNPDARKKIVVYDPQLPPWLAQNSPGILWIPS